MDAAARSKWALMLGSIINGEPHIHFVAHTHG